MGIQKVKVKAQIRYWEDTEVNGVDCYMHWQMD